jgi:hypothetical protein
VKAPGRWKDLSGAFFIATRYARVISGFSAIANLDDDYMGVEKTVHIN